MCIRDRLKIADHKGSVPSFNETLAHSQDTGKSIMESLQIGSGGAVETVFEAGKPTTTTLTKGLDGAGATGAVDAASSFKDAMGTAALWGKGIAMVLGQIGKGMDQEAAEGRRGGGNIAYNPEDYMLIG